MAPTPITATTWAAESSWIDDLDMRQYGWSASYYKDKWERIIIAIAGDAITLDAPIAQAIDKQYGGGEVYTYSSENRISNVGIENLWLESEYDSETDEDHGWNDVALRSVEDAWVRQVTSRYAEGTLLDNVQARTLAAENRQDSGSGPKPL